MKSPPDAASLALLSGDHRRAQAGSFIEAPDRGKGSHRAFVKSDASGRVRLVIVPYGKDIPRGTLLAILDQAGLTREEFVKLL